jgi:hypothetical protein
MTRYLAVLLICPAGWSSGLRSRLRNQRSLVQILVVSRGFCDELHLLTTHGCLYHRVWYIPYQTETYPC